MHRLRIGDSVFNLYNLDEALKLEITDPQSPVYVYDVYGMDFLRKLHLLQNRTRVAYAGVFFRNEDVEKVLRHINIYSTYTFGLYPERIDFDTYRKIYEFFLYSRLSTVYIYWFSSLVLKPGRTITPGGIQFDDKSIELPECEDCFLKVKGCSKATVFPDIFHPHRGIPSTEDFLAYCGILRHFAPEIANSLLSISDDEITSFQMTRESLGIRGQYWLDPFMIYG